MRTKPLNTHCLRVANTNKFRHTHLILLSAFFLFGSVSLSEGIYFSMESASQYFYENFDLNAGNLTDSANWTAVSAAGDGPVQVIDTTGDLGQSLSFLRLYPSGKRAELTGANQEDVGRTFSATTSGTLYYSFLMKVTEAPSANTFITYMRSGSVYGARLYTQPESASSYRLGISNSNTTSPSLVSESLDVGRTYFVVVEYAFITDGTDTLSLYLNPVPGQSQPDTPDALYSGTEISSFDTIALRQTTGCGTFELDELRVGTSWEAVAPFVAAPTSFSAGEAIPVGGTEPYGTIGITSWTASGTADVFGNGPYDLFVGLRNLYPFDHFDTNNVPVYGERIDISSAISNGQVFQDSTGNIYALASSDTTVYLRKFDKATLTFNYEATYTDMPRSVSDINGFISSDGKLHLFYTIGDGTEYYPVPGSHDIDYRPFDGSGFWTGGINYSLLYYARFSDTTLTTLETDDRVGTGTENYEFMFGCGGLAIANYGSGTLEHRLIGANKQGNVRSFHNASSSGMSINGMSYAVDNTDARVMLRHPIINAKPIVIANPASGLSDLIISDTGRIWHYPLEGLKDANSPIYGKRSPVLCRAGEIACGALPVISPGDVDNDGLTDFIIGNDAGELLFLRNIGTSGAAEFPEPIEILAGDEPLRIRSGYSTIQGPGEANWGYTCPTLFDWNADGKLDIVLNSSFGNILVLLQIDGTANPPTFTKPLQLFCDSLDLRLCWRSQPGVTTWGGQTDPCIIANDENDEFRCFYRLDNQNVIRGDVLRLTTGEAIHAHDGRYGGQWGRSKIVPVDWDQDGKIDLLVGTGRAQAIPGEGGIPDNLPDEERQSSVLFLRNAGSNASPEFEYPVRICYDDAPIQLGVHSCSPALADFGEGSLALVVGEEDGTIIYYPRDNLSNLPD
ncbi:FG-GAP repeat domain-containing protein [Tichowtungia aerotolerans]|uniref:VCBS repeat-containing protein n=1 Tax=Tichowtungia aerotolerans TaxID=2697043 RepID=A0A6P1MCV6_9BACT|nr:VCBS repeat-containing protein [Tichowtungia aerotolerans]QHI68925.1 hypothetical protein GT409_05505 [Tichowtungia aerotolerans]